MCLWCSACLWRCLLHISPSDTISSATVIQQSVDSDTSQHTGFRPTALSAHTHIMSRCVSWHQQHASHPLHTPTPQTDSSSAVSVCLRRGGSPPISESLFQSCPAQMLFCDCFLCVSILGLFLDGILTFYMLFPLRSQKQNMFPFDFYANIYLLEEIGRHFIVKTCCAVWMPPICRQQGWTGRIFFFCSGSATSSDVFFLFSLALAQKNIKV